MYNVFLVMHLQPRGENTYTYFFYINYALLLPLCTVCSYFCGKSADQMYVLRICARCVRFVERQSIFKLKKPKTKQKNPQLLIKFSNFSPDALCTSDICRHLRFGKVCG